MTKGIQNLISDLESKNKDTRYNASDRLVTLGTPAIPFLISKLLCYNNEYAQGMALWTLGEICPRSNDPRLNVDALAPLIAAIKEENIEVRRNAVWALGRIGGHSAPVELLISSLRDENAGVRQAVVEGLGLRRCYQGRESRVVDLLIGSLRDEDAEVRKAAAVALGNFGDNRAVPALKAIVEDSNEGVRRAVDDALNKVDRG